MKNLLSVVILAAGFGTRMKSKLPKVLHQISGQPMLAHILQKSYEISDNVSVVLGHGFDEIKNYLEKEFPNTKIYRQNLEKFPGTAGALFGIDFQKNGKTLVICGDMPLVKSSELLELANSDFDLVMSAFYLENPYGYGRVVTDKNSVLKIVEQKDANTDELKINLCNAGAYCFKNEVLSQILPQISNNNAQNEFYLTDAIAIAIKNGLKCEYKVVSSQNFIGINDKFALSQAEAIMQQEIKENLMKNGVIMHLPETIFIDSRAKFEGECIIEQNVQILGSNLINSSHIKASSVVENSVISNSSIGPMAHIRPKCEIKDSHIGNFVELKNAKLNGVKAGHLSYLGDCEIESGTNVGCGCITCNYDGKSKYKTKIGSEVFIGSNVKFIAPVNIADQTIIAAGSVVTKDSNKGDLVIARARQSNKAGFYHKFFGKNDE